jgi:hypothetical protein
MENYGNAVRVNRFGMNGVWLPYCVGTRSALCSFVYR